MSKVLWRPDEGRVAGAAITAFREAVETRWRVVLPDYAALHRWSVTHRARFWQTLWDVCGVVAERRGETALVHGDAMPGARWFPDARLNYAENLLRRRDDAPALVFRGEDSVRRRVSWRAFRDTVSRVAQALRSSGVGPGDRVAGYLPNMPETAAAMLAASSIGAVWSSCSPDFGVRGVLDRFGQIAPKVLIGCDGYRYNGRHHDTRGKLARIAAALQSAATVVMAAFDEPREPPDAAVAWDEWLAPFAPGDIAFARLPFDHPLMILFSSGTTGPPKCIVHGAGGTLLKHLCEHRLHGDVRSGDRLFYFTTCGWMMWNWLVSGLASEATLLLYDGSPFHPSGDALFRLRRRRGHDAFRNVGALSRSAEQDRPAAGGQSSACRLAHDVFHRLAAGAGELRLRLPLHQAGPVPVVDLRRHRHRRLLRARQSGSARPARRAAMRGARHGDGGLERYRRGRGRREGRARVHAAVPVDAGGLLERRGRRALPRHLFPALPPASGTMAISPRRRPRAA